MREALKLALEALENHCGNYKLDDAGCKRWNKAVAAINEALAQPDYRAVKTYHEGKPVACKHQQQCLNGLQCLCTAPPKEQQSCDKRPWVELTDEEIETCRERAFSTNNPYCPVDKKSMWKAYQYLEAKLKEKNT